MGKFNLAEHIQKAQPPQVRDIEAITSEILDAKRTGGEAILTIGRGLMEAKALLPHGEWLPWLEERVEFSEKVAQNFMRLARHYSNPKTLSDLGSSKALMLLAVPEEVREEFISVPHEVGGQEKSVADMSARELAQAIKERDEALKAAELAKAEQTAAEQAREKLSQEMKLANGRMEGLRDEVTAQAERLEAAKKNVALLEKELDELKHRPVEVAVQTDEAAVEAAREETEAAMRDKVKRATVARDKALEKRYELEKELEAAKGSYEKARADLKDMNSALQRAKLEREQVEVEFRKQLAQAEKKAALTSNEDLVLFRALFDQVQELVNKLGGVLLELRPEEPEKAQGLEQDLLALADKVNGFIGGDKAQRRPEGLVLNGWMPGGTRPTTDCDVVADFDLGSRNTVREPCQFFNGGFCWPQDHEPIDLPVVRWMVLPPVDGAPGDVSESDTGEDEGDGEDPGDGTTD